MSRALQHCRLDQDVAFDYVRQHHRHHAPPAGDIFRLGAMLGDRLIGVVIVGRPVSRALDDGDTLEVTRLCTDGHRYPTGRQNRAGGATFHNAASFLYGKALRAGFALGYLRVGTYILASETGTSLRAAGWRLLGETKGRSWSCPSRPRIDRHPLQDKLRFEPPARAGHPAPQGVFPPNLPAVERSAAGVLSLTNEQEA